MSLMLSSLHSVHSALIYDRISFYTHFPHIFLYTHFYGQPAENANYNNYVRYFPFGFFFIPTPLSALWGLCVKRLRVQHTPSLIYEPSSLCLLCVYFD